MARFITVILALLAPLLAQAPARAQQAVDLELVLAVDASSSVAAWEFDLQMKGIAAAFRDPDVQGAIRASGDAGIAVSLVQWSSRDLQAQVIDWTLLRSAEDAEAFAAKVDYAERAVPHGSTAIGNALQFSGGLLSANAFAGTRRVIDVSGDGRNNQGTHVYQVRDRLIEQGITVNGLAILNEDLGVDHFYLNHVIGGTGAFLITATDFDDFSRAIRQKLIREISGPAIAEGPHPAAEQFARDRVWLD
jgi:hypothetical protein